MASINNNRRPLRPPAPPSQRIERLLVLLGIVNVVGMVVLSRRTEMSHQHSRYNGRTLFSSSCSHAGTFDKYKDEEIQMLRSSRKRPRFNAHYDQNYTWNRLRQLGIPIDDPGTVNATLLRHLPPWQHVVDQYGDGPVLHGIDEWCDSRNQSHASSFVRTAPVGLFHSGTHLLYDLLRANCPSMNSTTGTLATEDNAHRTTPHGSGGVLFQPPWGKHTPYEYRHVHRVQLAGKDEDENRIALLLPIVTLRHPYDWFVRMCAVPYAARWNHSVIPAAQRRKLCPNLLRAQAAARMDGSNKQERGNPVTISFGAANVTYESLAHVWNRWYRSYYESLEPRIVVRLEDLVFYPDVVVRRLCQQCFGGFRSEPGDKVFQARLSSSKTDYGDGHGKRRMGLLETWIHYGWKRRYENWSMEDLNAARFVLDRDMMEEFGYTHPPMTRQTTNSS